MHQIKSRSTHSIANALIVHLFAADQQQSWAAARVAVRGGHARAPARLLRPAQRVTSLLVELKTFLAAAIVYPAVKRHVAIISLCGFIDGKLGLLGSVEGELQVSGGQRSRTVDVLSGVSPWSRHAVKWGHIQHSTVEHPCEALVYFALNGWRWRIITVKLMFHTTAGGRSFGGSSLRHKRTPQSKNIIKITTTKKTKQMIKRQHNILETKKRFQKMKYFWKTKVFSRNQN